ncbi:response regulator [Paraburkholderia sediminicola]|uniref:Response regulator n=1 Tax=Paraburkholderia rhynchosiae TaxID=487049 RepID=A0ACC7NIU9_9BURK
MANVLLVEDEADLLHALEALLILEGHNVRTAENGAEALHAVSQAVPDIVVTDAVMPGMDGIRLVRELRAAPLLAHIPVILTSAINVPRDLPVFAFLHKPFSAIELVGLINRLLL